MAKITFTSDNGFVGSTETFPVNADVTTENDVHEISGGRQNLRRRLLVTKLDQSWCRHITTSVYLNVKIKKCVEFMK